MAMKLRAIFAELNKTLAITALICLTAVMSLNSYIYDDSIQVHINVDGVIVKTITTKPGTVQEILSSEGISIEQGDVVIPTQDTKLLTSSTVAVKKLKSITVYNGNSIYDVKTSAVTATEFEQSGAVGLMPTDSVVTLTGDIKDGGHYDIKNAYIINVYADCATYPVYLSKGTVGDAVKAAGISLDADDFTTPSLETALYEGIEIQVVRVATVYTNETVEIPFSTERIENKYLIPGEEVVTVEGVSGEKSVSKVITYYNGEVAYENTTETVLRQAVNKVIEYGTWSIRRSSANSAPAIGTIGGYAYNRMISGTATAYCDKGTTASGIRSQVGVIAVDPRVIPLGTRLYVESSDGSWSYGVCVAGDTGGAIKGNKIDLFYDSYNQCIQFGRRSCNIYVLAD